MIPMSTLVTWERTSGSETLSRMNGYLAARFMGEAEHGISSGEAIAEVERIAEEVLPEGYAIGWIGQAFQEKRLGSSAATAFIFGIIVVFLILAAQYERWGLPFAVILAVPFGIFGALLGTYMRGLDNDIYFQIALVALVGLAAKNAILIVEFAVLVREQGATAYEAALQAVKLRFRPIIMTSLAFILGCVPLAVSTGAGAASRHSIGTAVVFGMLGATAIAPMFVPLFFYLISGGWKEKHDPNAQGAKSEAMHDI